ncbi:MAG: CPBP family intramembrane metalloprotease [Bacteroidales bacterium]|nr:CPBP family intramembrane metalloprotease [Bacteroidales bacterium]
MGIERIRKDLKYIIALLLVFSMFFIGKKAFFPDTFYAIEDLIHLYPISFFLAYTLVGLPVFLFVFFSNKKRIFAPLGLKSNILKGIAFSFVFSIPMFIGYGWMGNFEIQMTPKDFWLGCLFAAFFEELYYRGFFFGQLFRKTQLGFFPALILSALVFASLHLYQSNDLSALIGIFITTFMGAGLFAWLYVEWDYNLWLPIGLHFFMNLSWTMFAISDNALGDLQANLIRALTIIFAIGGTIIYKRKLKIPLALNKNTLLMKKTDLDLG